VGAGEAVKWDESKILGRREREGGGNGENGKYNK